MTSDVLFYCIIGILLLEFAVETVLDILNARRFDDPVPQEVENLYDPEEYTRSQAYKRVKFRFGLLTSGVSLLGILAFLIFGGFAWVDALAVSASGDPTVQALVFFGVLILLSQLLSLPFGYYNTFVIEERFGFNKTTPALFLADLLKCGLLMAVFGGGILALVMWFYDWAGADFWIYAWAAIALFTLLMNLF